MSNNQSLLNVPSLYVIIPTMWNHSLQGSNIKRKKYIRKEREREEIGCSGKLQPNKIVRVYIYPHSIKEGQRSAKCPRRETWICASTSKNWWSGRARPSNESAVLLCTGDVCKYPVGMSTSAKTTWKLQGRYHLTAGTVRAQPPGGLQDTASFAPGQPSPQRQRRGRMP